MGINNLGDVYAWNRPHKVIEIGEGKERGKSNWFEQH